MNLDPVPPTNPPPVSPRPRPAFDPAATAARIMRKHPADWSAAVAKIPPARVEEVVRHLDSIAERAATIAGYIDGGKRKALSIHTKVSRALGYTCPERKHIHIAIENNLKS